MKNIFKISTLFLFLLLLSSCSEDLVDKVQTATLKGIVIKKGTNQPIKNAKVFNGQIISNVGGMIAKDGLLITRKKRDFRKKP